MAPVILRTSVPRNVENVKKVDELDLYSCIRNVSVQTGEEFSPEFLRERKPRLELQIAEESFQAYHQDSYTSTRTDQRQQKRDTQNQQIVHEDASCSGYVPGGKEFPIEEEKTAYPDVKSRYDNKNHILKGYHQHLQQNSFYGDEIRNDQVCFSHLTLSQQPESNNFFSVGKLKFLCSFGGKILPRPSDGKLRYVGGKTRIISIQKNVNYPELVKKTFSIWNQPHTIKYQLPEQDLDALISVCSNEDFHHMIEEYHELEKGSQRLRVFLLSSNDPESPCYYDSMLGEQSGSEYEYLIAVNGMTGLISPKKCYSKENLDGDTTDVTTSNILSVPSDMSGQFTNLTNPQVMACSEQMNQLTYENTYHVDQINGYYVNPPLDNTTGNPQQLERYLVESGCENRPDLNKQCIVWEEDMIKWTELNNSNQEIQYAISPASSDMVSNLSYGLHNTTSQDLGIVALTGDNDSIMSSNLNVNHLHAHDLQLPYSAIIAPISSSVSLVESFEDNLGGKSLSQTSDDTLEYPVIVEDVTDNLPPGIMSTTQVGPHLQEEPSANSTSFDNQDVAYDKKARDELMATSVAEVEAGIHGLQIIKNDDLEELHELGSGTFGTVYHGKWRGTDIAIKRIRKSCFAGKSSEQERLTKDFWREAQMLSNLHHPNVVALYGVVPDGPGGTLSTVTEYMTNGSLRHVLLENNKTLDWRKKLIISQDAAIGMEYLHLKKIIHFDLKCENLLVNLGDPQRPICKVGDFGLSRIKRNTFVTGGVRGTLPWMAPELLNGSSARVSEKVDVFSFGIAMWEILTEDEPYADMHCGAIIGGIVSNMLRPPIPESCDRRWRALMEECWSHDPANRPTFTEITNKLQAMSMPLQPKRHKNNNMLKPL